MTYEISLFVFLSLFLIGRISYLGKMYFFRDKREKNTIIYHLIVIAGVFLGVIFNHLQHGLSLFTTIKILLFYGFVYAVSCSLISSVTKYAKRVGVVYNESTFFGYVLLLLLIISRLSYFKQNIYFYSIALFGCGLLLFYLTKKQNYRHAKARPILYYLALFFDISIVLYLSQTFYQNLFLYYEFVFQKEYLFALVYGNAAGRLLTKLFILFFNGTRAVSYHLRNKENYSINSFLFIILLTLLAYGILYLGVLHEFIVLPLLYLGINLSAKNKW